MFNHINKKSMKNFFEMMEQDLMKDGFTVKDAVVYGVVAPLGLIVAIGFAGWMESIF